MKRVYVPLILLILFFQSQLSFSEGFAAGTLVKIPDGYSKIEDLRVGDCVICCDKEKNFVESSVVFVAKQSVTRYMRIAIDNEHLCAACDQQFYNVKDDVWIVAPNLKVLASHNITAISLVEKAVNVYLVGVAEHHNFFVTTADICAHNFFPVVLAVSAVFGAGGIEIAGVSFGLAGLGTFLGYQWHKKSKQKHNVIKQPQFYGGGMMPEDPEDEKRKQRDQAR
ncbi:MAG TPA: hypothetical protein VJJ26_02315 [Candidatus Babeliales bacterium]|nr:hypothetical protein [Candidatus Babeliales bacterium]